MKNRGFKDLGLGVEAGEGRETQSVEGGEGRGNEGGKKWEGGERPERGRSREEGVTGGSQQQRGGS